MLDNFELYYEEDDTYLLDTLNEVRWDKLSKLTEKIDPYKY